MQLRAGCFRDRFGLGRLADEAPAAAEAARMREDDVHMPCPAPGLPRVPGIVVLLQKPGFLLNGLLSSRLQIQRECLSHIRIDCVGRSRTRMEMEAILHQYCQISIHASYSLSTIEKIHQRRFYPAVWKLCTDSPRCASHKDSGVYSLYSGSACRFCGHSSGPRRRRLSGGCPGQIGSPGRIGA